MRYSILAAAALASFVSSAVFAAVPSELEETTFSDETITPCPACLCAGPDGTVFVGVDQLGSLGKGPGKGRIVRLVDTDNDGKADTHNVYATLDNPRGLMAVGNKVYVLYTVWEDAKKFGGMHLGVLEDADGDGKADGPPKTLVSN